MPITVFFRQCPPFATIFGDIQYCVYQLKIWNLNVTSLLRQIFCNLLILCICNFHNFTIFYLSIVWTRSNLDFAIIADNGTSNKDLLVKKILELFPNKNIPVAMLSILILTVRDKKPLKTCANCFYKQALPLALSILLKLRTKTWTKFQTLLTVLPICQPWLMTLYPLHILNFKKLNTTKKKNYSV